MGARPQGCECGAEVHSGARARTDLHSIEFTFNIGEDLSVGGTCFADFWDALQI